MIAKVGNGTDLQGLEDDGLLDNILKRVLLSLSVCCLPRFFPCGWTCFRKDYEREVYTPSEFGQRAELGIWDDRFWKA